MLSAFTTTEEGISALFAREHAWTYLWCVILLSILSILIANTLINVNKEQAIRYTVAIPAQLRKDYQWNFGDGCRTSHSEDLIVCKALSTLDLLLTFLTRLAMVESNLDVLPMAAF